ncbi:fluoride efflux transporter FluC [Cellulomonas persica]|uniref:Fluoride-specific ion channel FluC n=1 Tax=Cellulomonas persica TaxID=76861 RepID=A0A510UVI1_9CELL|nr:CrcB family protein [Cellulomonas persica]GEK17491.1 putative fluoride ion transporter CrcB [Cellulomonas persica]
MIALLVALAGGLGAVARFEVDTLVARHNRWTMPAGTLVINVTSCVLLGMVTGWVAGHPGLGDLKDVLGVGFLGGYSTFSTASVEGARLLRAGRVRAAVLHAGGMLVASVAAAWLGVAITS